MRTLDSSYHGAMSVLIAAGALATLVACASYVPGRQTYWDEKIKEMCKKDGGFVVYEKIRISRDQIARRVLPMTADGRLGIAVKELSHPEAPVYAIDERTVLNEKNPRVTRIETAVVRARDRTVVAKRVRYARFGGDIPTGVSEASSFLCPDAQYMVDEFQHVFEIEGGRQ